LQKASLKLLEMIFKNGFLSTVRKNLDAFALVRMEGQGLRI